MRKDTEERRLKLLQLEGNGLVKSEIVKELTQNFDVSRQTCYNDFGNRDSWQPKISEMQHASQKILNRHDQLYRKAALQYIQAETVSQRLNAINQMRTINRDLYMFCFPNGAALEESEVEAFTHRWLNKDEAKMLGYKLPATRGTTRVPQ